MSALTKSENPRSIFELLELRNCQIGSEYAQRVTRRVDMETAPVLAQNPLIQLDTLHRYMDAMRTKVSTNIYDGKDTHGSIQDTTPDQHDVGSKGEIFHRSPREQLGDAVPQLSDKGCKAIAALNVIEEVREAAEKAERHIPRTAASKLAARELEKAIALRYSGVERQAYLDLGKEMKMLDAACQAYLKRYGHEITGETLDLLGDAAKLAKVASEIALETGNAIGRSRG